MDWSAQRQMAPAAHECIQLFGVKMGEIAWQARAGEAFAPIRELTLFICDIDDSSVVEICGFSSFFIGRFLDNQHATDVIEVNAELPGLRVEAQGKIHELYYEDAAAKAGQASAQEVAELPE